MKRTKRCRGGLEVQKNINFLDRALFATSRKVAKAGVYTDGNGFTITAGKAGMPTLADQKFLYFLLGKLQESGGDTVELGSVYSILKEMGCATTDLKLYHRFELMVDRLYEVSFDFETDAFYRTNSEGEEEYTHPKRRFRIITAYELSKDYISITFSGSFLRANAAPYSRKVSVQTMLTFENSLSLRLYEVLCKSFYGRDIWNIKTDNLLRKLGVAYTRPSLAITALEKAVKEMKNLASFRVKMKVIEEGLLQFIKTK